jgi:hypothetical protein
MFQHVGKSNIRLGVDRSSRRYNLMNKKYIAIVAAVIIIVVVMVVAAVVILPGLFKPPVDISGISLSTDMTGSTLLASTLAGKQLDQGSVGTSNEQVTTGARDFEVAHTTADYDGVSVHVIKAQFTSDASDVLDVLLSDDDWYGSASASTKTNDWFTASKGGRSVFFWRSDVWVFGIDAENDTVRNNAASDLVQHLRTL